MKMIKFAILGCGKIGWRHAEQLQGVEGACLSAVCDIVPEKADALAKKYGVKAYYNIDDLLKDSECDFVNVCTPSGLHPRHTIQSLDAGKNVLCEKPMAFKEIDARAMVKKAEEKKKFLFIVKQNRYNPPVKLALRLLKEGRLGKPIACIINMIWNRNEDYYSSEPWRATLELAGGTIYTQASHFVDLMLLFMGRPKTIFSFMGTKKHNIEIEDTGVIITEFANGGLGSLNYTVCATHQNMEGSLLLVGTEGTIKIGGEYLNTIEQFQVNGLDSYELESSNAGPNDYGTYKGSMSNHDKVFRAVVIKTKGGKLDENLVSGDEAIETVKFMEKAVESARTGRKINFD